MIRIQAFASLCGAIVVFVGLEAQPPLSADDKTNNKEVKVAGILVDKSGDSLTVKNDGEDEPVKYVIAKDADKKMTEALKANFPACRVQLTYKKDGDSRQLTSVKRQILHDSGTITGTVVKVYNDFWVEVKPKAKDALNDAFAPGINYKDKDFMASLKGLKPGDTVTIKYNTDFERHRILSMQVTERAKEKEKDK
jgi:hypothetical protein